MNIGDLVKLCLYFDLGILVSEPTPVHGGLLHKMWKCSTDKGIYAVKELSKKIDLSNQAIIDNYNLTEQIASTLQLKGIPAIVALEKSGQYLYITSDRGFLVYPWAYAETLDKDPVSEEHALKIAQILAKIHNINLSIPGISEPIFEMQEDSKIIGLVEKVSQLNCSFANELNDRLDMLLDLNHAFHENITILKNHNVVSHGDLDQKNILWDINNNPMLIDWESAGKINPTYDIVNTALYWSGITTSFDDEIFNKMLACYQKSGGYIDGTSYKAALYASAGNWINWLIFNIERACSTDHEQARIGAKQVSETLLTLLNLQQIMLKL